MIEPSVLAATWSDGVFAFTDEPHGRELAGRSVRALAADPHGASLAIVDGRSVCRRRYDGVWSTIATSHVDLACLAANIVLRTPDTVARMPHFECGAFNHSATSPEPVNRRRWL